MDEQNKVIDESNDRNYFTMTPRLVWALARTPYDYALWCVVKDIAGESRECYLSTPQLAVLAMMSTGQVKNCRDYLIREKLLTGEVRRDPGYPQPVWHMKIPNLWKRNTDWAEEHPKIADRLAFKVAFKKRLSSSESSKERSPGERGQVPGEKGRVPGETKKNVKAEQKENIPSPLSLSQATAKPTQEGSTLPENAPALVRELARENKPGGVGQTEPGVRSRKKGSPTEEELKYAVQIGGVLMQKDLPSDWEGFRKAVTKAAANECVWKARDILSEIAEGAYAAGQVEAAFEHLRNGGGQSYRDNKKPFKAYVVMGDISAYVLEHKKNDAAPHRRMMQ